MSNTLSWKNVDYQVGGGRQRYSIKWDPLRVVAKEANVRRILNNGKRIRANEYNYCNIN